MKLSIRYLLTIGLATVLTASDGIGTEEAANRGERVLNVSTGLVGLPPGHTAKLTLATVGKKSAPPATARLVILDETDKVLSVENVTVGPGRPASIEVNRDQIPRSDDRVPVRASVLNPLGDRARRDLVLTFEIFDATNSVSPNFAVLMCPQKIPGRNEDVIDCEDPCGCVVGIPGDFAGGPTAPTPTP